MARVFDVAKYILTKTGRVSTWKLQKLCFYAQAWALAWHDNEPLFNEDFEAWANGPVCRSLYNEHRGMYMIQVDELKRGDIQQLTKPQIDDIDAVLDFYGDKDPYWLREQTHSEDPWMEARRRGKCAEAEPCDEVITKDEIGLYYGSL